MVHNYECSRVENIFWKIEKLLEFRGTSSYLYEYIITGECERRARGVSKIKKRFSIVSILTMKKEMLRIQSAKNEIYEKYTYSGRCKRDATYFSRALKWKRRRRTFYGKTDFFPPSRLRLDVFTEVRLILFSQRKGERRNRKQSESGVRVECLFLEAGFKKL